MSSLLTLSPKTIDVFIALNLSPKAAQSARGEPEMETTRRTMDLARGRYHVWESVVSTWTALRLYLLRPWHDGKEAGGSGSGVGAETGKKLFFKIVFCAKKVC